jgi:hypothetical protein
LVAQKFLPLRNAYLFAGTHALLFVFPRSSWLNAGSLTDTSHADFILPPARLRDVVRGLHPHERVHLYAKGFLNTQGHVAR